MDSGNEIKLLQTIYDRIYDIVTYSPGGDKKPVFDVKTTFIQVVPLGLPINSPDFANAVTPTNPNGSLTASENFARLIDPVPAVQADYSLTEVSVDRTYGTIVSLANTTETVDEKALATYTAAYNFLNQTTTIKDFTGKETTVVADTPVFAAYKTNMTAYMTALVAYRNAYNNYDLTDPKQQREWQANAPLLQVAVDNTWTTWRAQGATQVEEALAAMNNTINQAVRRILTQDTQIYNQSQMTGNVSPTPWHLSYTLPTNWYDPSAGGFTSMNISTQNMKTSSSSQFTSYGGGARFNYGLWSVGGSFQHSEGATSFHTDATNLQISMELGVVRIVRPWLDGQVFSMGGWNMGQAYKQGKISTGDLSTATAQKAVMPLMSTAFVVARNISIQGDWSAQDRTHIESATKSSASVGWGPFQLSGSYSTSSSKDTFSSDFQNGIVRVPGMQIVAFVNEIVPLSPPQDGSAAESVAAAKQPR